MTRQRQRINRTYHAPLPPGATTVEKVVEDVASSLPRALFLIVEEIIIPALQPARRDDNTALRRGSLLLRIPDAANVLGIGRTTLYKLIDDGDINVVHIGRAVRVPVTELYAFVDRLHQQVTT